MNKPKILIVEDNPISRKILRFSLESENYSVIEAVDGASALREATNQKLDLIIQDLFLPDIDGFALNKKLREISSVKEIPIFALSGFLSQQAKDEQCYGFTTFLLKPIEPSYLLGVVRAHLPILMPVETSVGQGRRILIADDNPIQLKLFYMQLKNDGFEVTTARDGVIALHEAKLLKPDIVISDILMPNMDGFSLCAEIKRDPELCSIPVILLTSHYLEQEDLALANSVGASCYLTRTPDHQKLLHELIKTLDAKPNISMPVSFELSEETKENHNIRSMRQLEQQVLDNTKLAQRCAMLMSQLSLIGGVSDALTTSNKNVDESLKDVLYFCLDATGISKGALFTKQHDQNFVLKQQLGYANDQIEVVTSFFGAAKLILKISENNQPFLIPGANYFGQDAINFLKAAEVESALVLPLFSGAECLGLLYLGSNLINLSGANTLEFIRTLGMQFGQSIALASAFDKLGSSEKRYRQLVEISPDAILIQQNDKFVYANSSALKLLSVQDAKDLYSRSCFDVFTPEYQGVIRECMQQNACLTSTANIEGKIVNLKGDVLDVELVISAFVYQDKQAVYMIMRDITERKRSALHLEIQYAIAWILAESSTLYAATGKILKTICERLRWDCGAIWAVDENVNVLRCTRVWHTSALQNNIFQQDYQNITIAMGVGSLGTAWKDRRATWIRDIKCDENFIKRPQAIASGLNTAIAFPIIYENKVLGVVEFLRTDILQSNADLLLWFESIGNQLGLFLIRKHMEKQMLYLAEHDGLTGLSNRNLLEQCLTTELSVAAENEQKLAILFLDLDNFKFINDSMGHETGDYLLKETAARFQKCLRSQDAISRLGGDEFVIILPEIHQNSEIVTVIDRIRKELLRPFVLQDIEFVITVSIGISIYPDDSTTVQGLIKDADVAMYSAKEQGRNNYQFCTSEMTAKAENRGILQNDLRLALENNEFTLYYQPKIDIAKRTVVGMEALIRWQKSGALILPGSFIAAAESCDLINSIGGWVFKEACTQNKIWQGSDLPIITMSVNLSARNLNRHFLENIEQILVNSNLLPGSLEIELTESVLMHNVENNIQILRDLKEMGLKISIDDFGTGYSSLSYLKRFPVDIIKIDQSFVRDLATNSDDAAIVNAIITMAHSLGFKVIAEGVENKEQLKFLCEHGCDEIQGYYFSRPLPAEQAAEFIKHAKIGWLDA